MNRMKNEERAVLIALYNATGGNKWKNKKSWRTEQPLGKWFGVTTNIYGQVTELALNNNQLSGSIPVELAQLSNLEYLSLEGNAGLHVPTDAKFQAWLKNLKNFSVDDYPAPVRVKQGKGNDVGTIERLLDAVKPPSDTTQTLELLESFLLLAKTFEKKVGAVGDRAAASLVFAASIEKLQDDLTEIEKTIEKTIADFAKQTENVEQQRSVLEARKAEFNAELDDKTKELETQKKQLEARNAALDAELDDKTKELETKKKQRDAKNKEREDKEAALEKRRSDLEKVKHLLAELSSEIPRVEAAIQKINNEGIDLVLRVDDTDQKFHDAVEGFLQSQRNGIGIVEQIGDMMRLHHGDDAQILAALKQWEDSEPADLNTAIDLVDKIAKNLGDLDRCLGALTKQLDSTS